MCSGQLFASEEKGKAGYTVSTSGTGLYSSTLSSVLSNVNNAFSGKTNGIDVSSTVSELMQLERQPETLMQQQQSDISNEISLLTSINNDLGALQTATNNLRDIGGALSQMSADSTNSSIVTATAGSGAAVGEHIITVSNLASTSTAYSDVVANSTNWGGAQVTVAYGDSANPTSTDQITIPASDTTLQEAADYINSSSSYRVTANVVIDTTGSRLVLVSKNSGSAGNLTVTSSVTGFTQGTAGKDAHITVDGVPVSSATNTVSGALAGVTLSLAGTSPDSEVIVNVAPDATQAVQAISSFVSAYNAVINDINAQYTVNSSTQAEGVLAGDSSLRQLQSELLAGIAASVTGSGGYTSLQSLGIEMQDDGTLQVNTTTLNDAVSNNYGNVQSFFQSAQGFGLSFGTLMTQLTDVTEGPISLDITGLNNSNNDLTNQINDFEARMTSVQQQLTEEYSNLNTLLEQYPLQMQQIAEQLSSLPGASSSSS